MKSKKKSPLLILIGVLVILCGIYVLLKLQSSGDAAADEESAENDVIYEIAADNIEQLSFYIADEEYTFLQEDSSWTLKGYDDYPVDSDQIGNLTGAISSVKANRTLEDVDDLSEYGLENPTDVVTIIDTDGNETTISIGDTNISTSDCYIYLNDEKETVYTVSGDLATVFSGSLMNFAKSEAIPTFNASNITMLTVSANDASYTLAPADDGTSNWIMTDQDGNQTEVSSANVSNLTSTASGITYSGYEEYNCQDYSLYGLDQPQAVIKITYTAEEDTSTSEEDAETETVLKEVEFHIGNQNDNEEYYVNLNGSTEVHTISAETIDAFLSIDAATMVNLSYSSSNLSDLEQLTVTYQGETHSFTSNEVETGSDSEDSDSDDDESDTQTVYLKDGEEIDTLTFSSFFNEMTSMEAQRITTDEPVQEAELTIEIQQTDGTTKILEYSVYDTNFYLVKRNDGNHYLVNKMKVKELLESYQGI